MDIDVKDPKFLRWAGAILLAVVALPMYFLSDMYPFTFASGAKTQAELMVKHEVLSRDLEKARLLVRNLERVEQEYAILHQQWDVAQTLLPEENQMPDLLRKVTAAGQQSGVEFELFRPKPTLAKGFYSDNPIEVRIQGGYHQTGVFLSRLANLNRIVNVSDLKIKGVDEGDGSSFTMETDMTLTAYTLETNTQPSASTVAGKISPTEAARTQVAAAAGKH
jgi:type IV pilus assembly protein PilO